MASSLRQAFELAGLVLSYVIGSVFFLVFSQSYFLIDLTLGLLGMPGLALGWYVLQLSLRLVVPIGFKQKFLNSENVQGGKRKLQALKNLPDQKKINGA